jgi:hypothetical protein
MYKSVEVGGFGFSPQNPFDNPKTPPTLPSDWYWVPSGVKKWGHAQGFGWIAGL